MTTRRTAPHTPPPAAGSAGESAPERDATTATCAALPFAAEDDEDEREVDAATLLQDLDLADTRSIIAFGSEAQAQLDTVTVQMLEGVRQQEAGDAGAALDAMLSTLRGFDVDALDPGRRKSLLARFFAGSRPLIRFLQRFGEVQEQVEAITLRLEAHQTTLLTDLTRLDRLYQAALESFHLLEAYIHAGELRLTQVDAEELPASAAGEASAAGDDANADAGDALRDQAGRDLRAARDELERRLHDLRLTRQVTMQSLPSIRLVQENNKGLVNRINSTLRNTVPLWRQQLATAIAVFHSGEAARAIRATSDLTNELLAANARSLQRANADARRQIERGAVDVDAIKAANQTLIDTIEDSLAIAGEGRRARASAQSDLVECETRLRAALADTGARDMDTNPARPPPAGTTTTENPSS